MDSHFALTRVSGNKKTGPIPVSISSKDTCPTVCPLRDGGGCYAELGPLNLHWLKVTAGARKESSWKEFLSKVKSLPRGQLWRHNQAGDLCGEGLNSNRIDEKRLQELIAANKKNRKHGFTYTHFPVVGDSPEAEHNRHVLSKNNPSLFTINLSADSLGQVDGLLDTKVGPVVTILPSEASSKKSYRTPGGNRVVVCPATNGNPSMTSCDRCGLCQIFDRNYAIGFPAHGGKVKLVNKLTRGEK